jgi:hypothetical protein
MFLRRIAHIYFSGFEKTKFADFSDNANNADNTCGNLGEHIRHGSITSDTNVVEKSQKFSQNLSWYQSVHFGAKRQEIQCFSASKIYVNLASYSNDKTTSVKLLLHPCHFLLLMLKFVESEPSVNLRLMN